MKRSHRLRTMILVTASLAGLAVNTSLASSRPTGSPAVQFQMSPLRPAPPGVTGAEIFARLLKHNHLRDAQLEKYSAVRTYQVTNDHGKIYATEVVRMHYLAPDHKQFSVSSVEGSLLVRHLVLNRLIKSEATSSSGKAHRSTSLKPANYSFELLGVQDIGPYHCYVVRAHPKRKDKHLLEGRIWIDSRDYGVVRISGEPAAKLSFWIEKADFVRQYQRIGEFWLPCKDESTVQVRLAGIKILTIVHQRYSVNGRVVPSLQVPDALNARHDSEGAAGSSGLREVIAQLPLPIHSESHIQVGADDLH